MIIIDLETTGLSAPSLATPAQQPYIIEFAARKLGEDGSLIHNLGFFVKPPVPITPEITKITGITQAMVDGAKSFAAHLPAIQEFFLGERLLIAHNLAFDRGVLAEELKRLDALLKFPWPPEHFCTVENTQDLGLKDRKLVTLYQHYIGKPLAQTHRAADDVSALTEIVVKMINEGRIG